MENKYTVESFFTREKGEEGVIVPLVLPSGAKTEHWLKVRSVDSVDFKRQVSHVQAKFAERVKSEDSKQKQAEMVEERNREFLAHLIVDWSFERECNFENKVEVLFNAPAIADAVDKFANTRGNFMNAPAS